MCENILDEIPMFMNDVQRLAMQKHGLNVFDFQCDHVCYRTETAEEYLETRHFLLNDSECTMLLESMINGRPISLLKLPRPVWYGRCADGFDLVSCRSSRLQKAYRTGWQHAGPAIKS